MAAERISEPAVVWKDRKRICGLPITFTKYSMSEDRLFLETGLLNTRQEEVILYRVRDISLSLIHIYTGKRFDKPIRFAY